MKKRVIVISLGGSLIVPDKINQNFLHNFKKTLIKNFKTHRFVIVCGGGTIARKYISALKKENKSNKEISLAGIMATRMNARLIMQLFGPRIANDSLPKSMEEVKSNLSKNSVVICGALRFATNSTSDGTSAKLANFLNCPFINMTNVKGLYSANPKTNKDAKFIPYESWKNFESRALKLSFKAGQHFVLDQQAAVIIRKHKIPTYIIGENLNNISKILKGKKFVGTFIGDKS